MRTVLILLLVVGVLVLGVFSIAEDTCRTLTIVNFSSTGFFGDTVCESLEPDGGGHGGGGGGAPG